MRHSFMRAGLVVITTGLHCCTRKGVATPHAFLVLCAGVRRDRSALGTPHRVSRSRVVGSSRGTVYPYDYSSTIHAN